LVKKLAILFSGEGSNLRNLIKKLHHKDFDRFSTEVVLAITNNPSANGILKAQKLEVKTLVLDHKSFSSREAFDTALVDIIRGCGADLTLLAGFMRILTPHFTDNITAINIHPSILPLFKGGNALEESYLSNMKVAGATVHFVSNELDSGDIIEQGAIQKIEGEDFLSFKKRIHSLEHRIYPKAVIKALEILERK